MRNVGGMCNLYVKGEQVVMCDHLLLLGSVKEKKISHFFFIDPQPLKRGGHAGNSNNSEVKRAIALFFMFSTLNP